MELTDTQLFILLDCDVWTVSNISRRNKSVIEELECLDLLVCEALQVIKPQLPKETHFWKLTDLGHEMIIQNKVRALELLTGSNMVGAARKHFKKLTIDELPSLLTHSNIYIRFRAQQRMKELMDGVD